MAEIAFYHLTKSNLEQALPKLLDKMVTAKKRAVVRFATKERVLSFNNLLWTAGQGSFTPHGCFEDDNPSEQPVWLTTTQENPNNASFLISTEDNDINDFEQFEKYFDMFNGNDPESLARARSRWATYKTAGHSLTYWQQAEDGSWQKKN